MTSVSLIETFYTLRQDYERLTCGTYLLSLTEAVVEPEQSFDYASVKQSLGNKFRETKPVQVNDQYFLVSKKQKTFLPKLDKALKMLKDNGTLKKLSKQYFGEDVFQYKESAE